MQRLNLVAIGVACLLGASAALATEPSSTSTTTATVTTQTTEKHTADFNAMDANHDGYVSSAEAKQGGMTDYGIADSNSDGRLDNKEFSTAVSSTHSTEHHSSSSESSSTSMSKPSDPTNKMP